MHRDASFRLSFPQRKPLARKRGAGGASAPSHGTRRALASLRCRAKINVTPFKETVFCLEMRRRQAAAAGKRMTCGSHRKVIQRRRNGRSPKRESNVMKGLCKSYTRSARGSPPSAVWERLGIN